MGGAVSAGEDNEELVDNLVEADYLKSPSIEKALRAVDRGSYYLQGHRDTAYKDLAWKHGKLHISAPCIYSEVLECLEILPGMSFLNLGSGTGYLSTVIGLLLGANGINHGVEIHGTVVDYAKERLEEFIKESPAIDMLDFSCPQFVVGNCLELDPSTSFESYDRVYCGAAVPEEQQSFIRSLIRINGIAVMPCGDQLQKIKRVGQNDFDVKSVLPVSFATMILPTALELAQGNTLLLPNREPQTLQNMCRVKIRQCLRQVTLEECPETQFKSTLQNRNLKPTAEGQRRGCRRRRRIRRIVIPVFHTDSEDEDENHVPRNIRRHIVAIRTSGAARGPTGRIQFEDLRFNRQIGDEDEEMNEEEDSSEEMKGTLAAEAPRTEEMQSQEEEETCDVDGTSTYPQNPEPVRRKPSVVEVSSGAEDSTEEVVWINPPERLAANGMSSDNIESGADESVESGELRKSMIAAPPFSGQSDEESDDAQDYKQLKEQRKADRAEVLAQHKRFSQKMKQKVASLPLPAKLRNFVNYHRQ